MKPLFAALSVAFLLGTTVSVHAAEQAKPTDRSVQVYKKADLAEWNRENAAGGKGPLLGRFAFNRHQTAAQDAFREIGWLTLPPGASIGEHKHTDNEDVYIIVSGKGVFTDSTGKQTQVGAGDITIDIVTDQTSAHDPLSYLPRDVPFEAWHTEAAEDPVTFTKKSRESMAAQVQAMVEFQDAGAEVFDYGNSIRDEARHAGYARAFEFPGFVPAYIRPLFCEGLGPFRWAALSGDPEDIRVTDQALKELFPDNEHLHRWLDAAEEYVEFEGLPARICWLGYGERHKAGLLFNQLVAEGKISAPIVIGRDHLDSGSVASPYRETEAMLDGSDAIADWPLLNALTAASSGATWVSIHHGGGVGIGRSIHAGQVCVADGTELAAQKLERVLTNDPGMGVVRHFDAGYNRAAEVAAERGITMPMEFHSRETQG